MEMNFLLMVAAALVGLVVNAIWKFNPWAILGSVSFLLLVSVVTKIPHFDLNMVS